LLTSYSNWTKNMSASYSSLEVAKKVLVYIAIPLAGGLPVRLAMLLVEALVLLSLVR
jgi:ACR3 family arsenite efflux pump ArsB